MNEDTNSDGKTLLRSGKTLSLGGKAGASTVKQSFSHGRTNSVVVERKRRRISSPGETTESETSVKVELKPKPKAQPKAEPVKSSAAKASSSAEKLTNEQQAARAKALAEANIRSVEEAKQAKIDEARRAEEDGRRKEAREKAEAEAKKAQAEEAARKQEDEEARLLKEAEEATLAAEVSESEKPQQRQNRDSRSPEGATASESEARKSRATKAKVPEHKPVRRDSERRQGRLTITKALSGDEGRDRSLASIRRRNQREKRRQQGDFDQAQQKISRQVTLPETITIQELANRMSERAADVIALLFKQGVMQKATDVIDADTAQLLAEELGHTVRRVSESDVEEGFIGEEDQEGQLQSRPPVITIMGHVDHGKTSLLDAIRQADVVSGEAGGITQHIGAYQVNTPTGNTITFLDTPGHAAFTAMRARGAETTDLVVLVVAADDGVKPQTIEAISHAKAAGVPMIVAINKIDRPGSDPNRVRTELLSHEVQVESMGGEVLEIEVSALKKQNIDKLLDIIHLQSEILELKANPDRTAEGSVVESRMDRGRGSVATVLVQRGTLKTGDIVVAGIHWGRVRALLNERGAQLKQASPSTPVEILGLSGTPDAGDAFAVVTSEAKAREITSYRERQAKERALAKSGGNRISLEQMMLMKASKSAQLFTLLVKADVFGSTEAIIGALEKLGTDEVKVQVVHSGVGGINESDVVLAKTTGAAIVGFNVRANKQALDVADREKIEIRYYRVIYDLVDDIKQAMEGLLAPELRETWLGNSEVLEVFSISKVGKIAGCRVSEGTMQRGAHVRLVRDDIVIHEGKLSTLKRFKDEVKEVQPGQECGMAFENYQDLKAGDLIECYSVEEVKRTLS